MICIALALTTGRMPASELMTDDALLAAAAKALPPKISKDTILKALEDGLWNSNRTTIAISCAGPNPEPSVVFVFLRQANGTFLAVDISVVENGNFSKIGIARRPAYDRFETKPIKWLNQDDGSFCVDIRTRAWKDGQRYTVVESLTIKPDGTVWWR